MAKYTIDTETFEWIEENVREGWYDYRVEETITISFAVKGLKNVHVSIEDCGTNTGYCEARLVLANTNSHPVMIRFKKGTTITPVIVEANSYKDYDIDKEDANWLSKCLAEVEIYASRF